MTPEQRETLKQDIRADFAKAGTKVIEAGGLGEGLRLALETGLTPAELSAYKADAEMVNEKGSAEFGETLSAAEQEMYTDGGFGIYFSTNLLREAFLKAAEYTEMSPELNKKARDITLAIISTAPDHSAELKSGKLKPYNSMIG